MRQAAAVEQLPEMPAAEAAGAAADSYGGGAGAMPAAAAAPPAAVIRGAQASETYGLLDIMQQEAPNIEKVSQAVTWLKHKQWKDPIIPLNALEDILTASWDIDNELAVDTAIELAKVANQKASSFLEPHMTCRYKYCNTKDYEILYLLPLFYRSIKADKPSSELIKKICHNMGPAEAAAEINSIIQHISDGESWESSYNTDMTYHQFLVVIKEFRDYSQHSSDDIYFNTMHQRLSQHKDGAAAAGAGAAAAAAPTMRM